MEKEFRDPSSANDAARDEPRRASTFSLAPEQVFLAIAAVFGVALCFLTPPFEVPDEPAHFFQAYAVSELKINYAVQNNVRGAVLPSSLRRVAEQVMEDIPTHSNRKTSIQAIRAISGSALMPDSRSFTPLRAAGYMPVAYVPMAIALFAGRQLDMSVLALLFMARIANLGCALVLCFIAIKLIPFYKWLLTVIALMPMVLFFRSSVSTDALITSCAFLLIALLLHCRELRRPFNRLEFWSGPLLVLLIALAKPNYASLAAMSIALLHKPAADPKGRIVFVLFLALAALGGAGASMARVQSYQPFDPGAAPESRGAELLRAPKVFASMAMRTQLEAGPYHLAEFIGRFGWLDTPIPYTLRVLYLSALILMGIIDGPHPKALNLWLRCLLLMVFWANFIAISLICYVTTPPGDSLIKGIQGRYYIPFSPLLFMSMSSQQVSAEFSRQRTWLYVAIFTAASSIVTAWTIWRRFYS